MDGAMVGIIGTDRGYGVSYAAFGTDRGAVSVMHSYAVFGKRCNKLQFISLVGTESRWLLYNLCNLIFHP